MIAIVGSGFLITALVHQDRKRWQVASLCAYPSPPLFHDPYVCFFFLGLPMLGFASLTKNFMETIVAGVAVFFGV